MCYACPAQVTVSEVRSQVGRFAAFFIAARILPSLALGIAIRMIAHLAQNAEFHAALGTMRAQEIADATFVQVSDYAREFHPVPNPDAIPGLESATVADRMQVMELFNKVMSALADAEQNLSNPLCAAFLCLSDLMFETGINPPTDEQFQTALDSAVFQFNAEKMFANPDNYGAGYDN